MKTGIQLALCAGVVFGSVGLSLSGAGCSATTTNAVIQDITPAGACIADQLLSGGATDPLQIVAACAGVTIDDVIQVVEQLLAAQPDGGLVDGGPTPLASRLAAVHTRALSLKVIRGYAGLSGTRKRLMQPLPR